MQFCTSQTQVIRLVMLAGLQLETASQQLSPQALYPGPSLVHQAGGWQRCSRATCRVFQSSRRLRPHNRPCSPACDLVPDWACLCPMHDPHRSCCALSVHPARQHRSHAARHPVEWPGQLGTSVPHLRGCSQRPIPEGSASSMSDGVVVTVASRASQSPPACVRHLKLSPSSLPRSSPNGINLPQRCTSRVAVKNTAPT